MTRTQKQIVIVGVLVLVGAALAVQGYFQQRAGAGPATAPQPGQIHLYVDGRFRANLAPADLQSLPQASFQDTEENKAQEGPWLKDVILRYLDEDELAPTSVIQVEGVRSSTDQPKRAQVTWAQTRDEVNHLVLDVSGSGDSLKLVSTLPQLDTRDEWVQGIARIDVTTKP